MSMISWLAVVVISLGVLAAGLMLWIKWFDVGEMPEFTAGPYVENVESTSDQVHDDMYLDGPMDN